ncbi:MAG: type II toxin-antitoxin system RelB/DinJ family antitoxin [Gordonibacter sp.]|nr:type II toxin-antitoxin system RelB/DinJ family antitoxin [Gordonibacter sp.]
MSAMATLNVRLPEDLKERGMQVLSREGVSVSKVVRDLFCQLEETQEIPTFLRDSLLSEQEEIHRKRELLRSMVGIVSVPPDFDYREERRKHLEWKHRPGVRV